MNDKSKKELKYFIKLLVVFFLFYFSAYLQYIPIIIFKIKNIDGTTSVLLNTFSNIVLFIVLIVMYRKDLIREWK